MLHYIIRYSFVELSEIVTKDTLYCKIYKQKNALKCDAMIGLNDGNISLALLKEKKYSIPLSSLDFDIKNVEPELFEVKLLASKPIFSKDAYSKIIINKISLDDLPQDIKNFLK